MLRKQLNCKTVVGLPSYTCVINIYKSFLPQVLRVKNNFKTRWYFLNTMIHKQNNSMLSKNIGQQSQQITARLVLYTLTCKKSKYEFGQLSCIPIGIPNDSPIVLWGLSNLQHRKSEHVSHDSLTKRTANNQGVRELIELKVLACLSWMMGELSCRQKVKQRTV